MLLRASGLSDTHTIEVLREIGMAAAQIDELQREDAITAAGGER